jgi:hypothetical protein
MKILEEQTLTDGMDKLSIEMNYKEDLLEVTVTRFGDGTIILSTLNASRYDGSNWIDHRIHEDDIEDIISLIEKNM